MKKMAKKVGVVLVALVVLVLILAWMSGAFRDKVEPDVLEAPQRKAAGLETIGVHKIVQQQMLEVVGTLRAERRTEVSPRIMAMIEELNVHAGEKVEKGQVLARLDARDLTAQVEAARQAVHAAEVRARNAERDYERFRQLEEGDAASTKELDDASTNFEASQAQLRQAREALSSAETRLSYTVIKAPVSGTVVDKLMDEGDTAQPSRPLFSIYDPAMLRLEAPVPEALAQGLQVGDSLAITLDSFSDGRTSRTFGRVAEIVPRADAASRSVLVKVDLPESMLTAEARREGVIEGAFGRLHIPSRERVRLCLAESAVVTKGQLRYVDVVREDGTLEKRMIKLGERSPFGRVEVLSGLDAGERVVLYGPPPEPFPEGARLFEEGAAL